MNVGDKVDLYYYAESDHVRNVSGTITDGSQWAVIIASEAGDVIMFPMTSVQRMILRSKGEGSLT